MKAQDQARARWQKREESRLENLHTWGGAPWEDDLRRAEKLKKTLRPYLTLAGVRMRVDVIAVEMGVVEFRYRGSATFFQMHKSGNVARAKATIKKLIQEYHSGETAE